MKESRRNKLSEALREEAASFFNTNSTTQSLITVTRVIVSPDSKKATIYITVLPETQERAALSFAKRHIRDLLKDIRSHRRMGFIPNLDIDIDAGERHRQHLDELSQ